MTSIAGVKKGPYGEDQSNALIIPEPPIQSLEASKILLQKQYLLFLQHIASNNCHGVFISPRNRSRLGNIFVAVSQAITGGGDGISVQGGIPLRRAALAFLSELAKDWIYLEDTFGNSSNTDQQIKINLPSNDSGKNPIEQPPPEVASALHSYIMEVNVTILSNYLHSHCLLLLANSPCSFELMHWKDWP